MKQKIMEEVYKEILGYGVLPKKVWKESLKIEEKDKEIDWDTLMTKEWIKFAEEVWEEARTQTLADVEKLIDEIVDYAFDYRLSHLRNEVSKPKTRNWHYNMKAIEKLEKLQKDIKKDLKKAIKEKMK